MMSILVAYASRHGATRGIAERIADTLRAAGLEVHLAAAKDARHLGDYDAFVIGSAAYMFHWMREASALVRRNRELLASRPVWLFSSGPLGTERIDPQGKDLLTLEPREIAGIRDANSRMRASSLAWMTQVCPSPPNRRMASQVSSAAAKSFTK